MGIHHSSYGRLSEEDKVLLVYDDLEVGEGRAVAQEHERTPKLSADNPVEGQYPGANTTKAVTCTEKTLRIFICPGGNFGFHLKEAHKKGLKWVNQLRRCAVPIRDSWLGFRHTCYNKMNYGFAAIVYKPHRLKELFQDMYFRVLLPLQVNMYITT